MQSYSINEKLNLLQMIVPEMEFFPIRPNLGEFRNRKIYALIKVPCIELLQEILKICLLPGEPTSLYPYSSGKNWGLGSFMPIQDNGILLDLSSMCKIIDLDLEWGIAVIEPGVTQLQLTEALIGSSYFLNVTSSHTTTSILGNILERGIGFHRQRDQDLLGAEVLLTTGNILKLGGYWRWDSNIKRAFHYKHGVGPNLLPLLFQSNMGIVTKGVISLLSKPEIIMVFKVSFFFSQFKIALDLFGQFYREEVIKSVMKIYNSAAVMIYRGESAPQAGSHFYGYFSLEGPASICEAKLRYISKALEQYEISYEPVDGDAQDKLSKMIYGCFQGNPKDNDAMINASFNVTDGNIDAYSAEGWISFLPVVPFDTSSLKAAFNLMYQCVSDTNIQSMATMNIISKSTVDFVIGLRFKRMKKDIAQVNRVLENLYRVFAKEGFYPYRVDINHMEFLVQQEHDNIYKSIFKDIKMAFDPMARLMVGRYTPYS